MPNRSATLVVAAAVAVIVSFMGPSAATAAIDSQCVWIAETGSLTATLASRKVELDRLGSVPCPGAPRDDEAAVPGLPHWSQVRELHLNFGDQGDGRGELKLSPQDFTRDGSELKIFVDALSVESATDFVAKLNYDSATSGARPKPLRVDPAGLDLNSDGDVDLAMPAGQSYSLDVTHTKWPASFDLRTLPAGKNQTVVVLGYRGPGPGVSRFWGPTSGASTIYFGGTRPDVVDTYGGDDVVWAGGGNNVIRTRGGDDTIGATSGNDKVWTGPGDDWAGVGNGDNSLYLGSGTNSGSAGYGRDVIRGGPGRDRVSDAGFMNIALGSGSDEIDLQGMRGGRVDCGSGRDYRHHLYERSGSRTVSCERFTAYDKVYPPIRYDWNRDAFVYLCSNGRMYRPDCPDPR